MVSEERQNEIRKALVKARKRKPDFFYFYGWEEYNFILHLLKTEALEQK